MKQKTVIGQPIITTSVDAYGEKLPLEVLQRILENHPDEVELNDSHDLTKPVIGKMTNPRIVKMENGEFAIVVDIEYYRDPGTGYTGFSISLVRDSVSFGPPEKANFQVYYDYHDYDTNRVIREFSGNQVVILSGLLRRGLENPDIITVAITGVLGTSGVLVIKKITDLLISDGYKSLKESICRLVIDRQKPRILIERNVDLDGKDVKIIIEVDGKSYQSTNDAILFEEAYRLAWDKRNQIKNRISLYYDSDDHGLKYSSHY